MLEVARGNVSGMDSLNKFGKATEKKVVYLINAFQILFILIGLLML